MKRQRYTLILILITLTLILLFSNTITISAFSYSGNRWQSSLVYYNTSSLPSSYRTAVKNAAATWTNAPGSTFLASSNSNSSNRWYSGNYGDNGWYGITYTNLTDGWITRAISYFNTYYSYDKETVALHEFGHWLHLNDQFFEQSVMFGAYNGIQRSLYPDDIAGIDWIYPY